MVYFVNKHNSKGIIVALWSIYTNKNVVIALVSFQIVEKYMKNRNVVEYDVVTGADNFVFCHWDPLLGKKE